MATLTITTPAALPAGQIIASGVSAENYLANYAELHHEWIGGVVIAMSPESLRHALLVKYVLQLVDAYLALNPIGLVLDDPFVMRLDTSNTYREPDVLVILKTNPGQLTNIALIGPADLCVEVVSPESATRDYGDKFIEYEKAGVREYWIIDPLRQRVQFNRLDAAGVYTAIQPDEADRYTTPLLPRLYVHVPTLWQDTLPNAVEIMQMVQAMLAE